MDRVVRKEIEGSRRRGTLNNRKLVELEDDDDDEDDHNPSRANRRSF